MGAAQHGLGRKLLVWVAFASASLTLTGTLPFDRLSFLGVETSGSSEVDFPLSPRCCTDSMGVIGLWFLLSVNPSSHRVFSLPCLFPLCLLHSCLQMEMQVRVCGETGSLASGIERVAALESHPLPYLGSARRGSSTLVVSTTWVQGPQPAGLSKWLFEV